VVWQLYISIMINVMVVVVVVVVIVIIIITISPLLLLLLILLCSSAAFPVLPAPVFSSSHSLFLLLYVNFLYTAICLHSFHTSIFLLFLGFPVSFFSKTSFQEFILGFCC